MKLSKEVLARRVFSRAVNDRLIASTIMGCLDPFIASDRAAIDVGAATGHFTDYFASRCRGVYAFEAVPHVWMQLAKKETEFPGIVHTFNKAVSNYTGKAEIFVDDKRLSNSGFQDLVGGPKIEVSAVALDDFLHTVPGFIKIDVEGTELAVIQGAEKMIEKHRPNMLVEIYKPYAADPLPAIFEFLMHRHNYGCCYHDGKSLVGVPTVEAGVEAVETKHNLHDGDFLFTNVR